MDAEVRIRPARTGDRLAMERICARTWDWGDYIPDLWEQWLADEQGQLIVGEVAERVVALSKITFHPADQVWLEGMRVEPDYRRRGIAGQFMDYSLVYARERGARVVRLGTSDQNTAVHAIIARVGMERVGAFVLRTAKALSDGPRPVILGPAHASAVQAFIEKSRFLDQTHGLFSVDWAWEELTAERMAGFLQGSCVLAHIEPDGVLTALALVAYEPDDEEMWIGFADGKASAVTALATTIRVHAARLGPDKVNVMLPDIGWLRSAFAEAGFGVGDWNGELWIFERWLIPTSEDSHDG